jgi:hypothetical protein
MRSGPARILAHRGHGPDHLDLVLGAGRTCTTLSATRIAGRWSARWLPAHRRRYLSYRGAIGGGRGVVRELWKGRAVWHRHTLGWCVHLLGHSTWRTAHTRLVVTDPALR